MSGETEMQLETKPFMRLTTSRRYTTIMEKRENQNPWQAPQGWVTHIRIMGPCNIWLWKTVGLNFLNFYNQLGITWYFKI